MSFFTGTVAERTPAGQRQSIQEKSYTFHVYNRGGAENLVGECYPSAISFPQAQTYVAKYQDPKQADAIMKVQQELDETKIVLHKTIEAVLEKLDDLVDRSNNLSMSSKQFYKSAKKVCLLLSILNTR
ncbi:unnamed protein product [Rhizoctonia solani]|nr:unnamed protein product [Rhizoctonia solani]